MPDRLASSSGSVSTAEADIRDMAAANISAAELNAVLGTLRPLASLRRRILRPDDLLLLDVTFDNLQQASVGPQQLVKIDPSQPARLVVEHQPQAIADEAFQQVADQGALPPVKRTGSPDSGSLPAAAPTPLPPAVARSRMSGPSRLVFNMPEGVTSLGFDLASILEACRTWPMSLDWAAQPPPRSRLFDDLELGGLLRTDLQNALEYLKASLPEEQRPTLSRMLERSAVRLSAALAAAERAGPGLDEAGVDALIAKELDAALRGAPGPPEATGPDGGDPARPTLRQTATQILQISAANRTLSNIQASRPALSVQAQRADLVRPQPAAAAQPAVGAAGAVAASSQLTLVQLSPVFKLLPTLFQPHAPGPHATAIELPYRLIQSPLSSAGWAHATGAVVHGGRTELWHTRLGARISSGLVDDEAPQPLRAIWSPDYPMPFPPDPFDMSLDGHDRTMLVKLTAGYTETALRQRYTPLPVTAQRLMLTALGGWLYADGDWPIQPDGVDIQQWNHRAALARDFYVRVVYAGFLFPFGHAASLVKVTERKFESQLDGKGRIAVLRQRFFIIVREPVKLYPGPAAPHGGKDFPFHTIEILTKVTPDLAKPGLAPNDRLPDAFYDTSPAPGLETPFREAFWPSLGASAPPGQATDFLFNLSAVDGAGRRIPFQAPLLFLSKNVNLPARISAVIPQYAASKDSNGEPRPTRAFKGAKVQFAPQALNGDASGDTNMPTATITFRAAPPTSAIDPRQPQFHPGVNQADIVLAAVQQLLGSDKPATVKFSDIYLGQGLGGANTGQVFLDIVNTTKMAFGGGQPTDKVGGLLTPDLTPSALSRTFGVVAGDVGTFAGGQFDPASFLPDAKLLGVISLKDVLHLVGDIVASSGAVPKFSTVDLPDRIEAGYSLHQTDLASPTSLFVPDADGQKSVLDIQAKTAAFRDGSPPQAFVDASLTVFKVNLFGFIILTFDRLHFHAEPGHKADVNVDLNRDHGVLFGGPLEFVNTLKDIIPSNGFADPPDLQVTPQGITASYALGIPTVGVGVFSLANLSLGAGFDLPFNGDPPSARFNFAERHNTFSLTVSLFGGGGFFAIAVDAGGVNEIEAALEFGAAISIDLGVASGGVYVKGGVYFHWKVDLVELEGYVELGGHLSVLGLITVSLVFHLSLSYQKAGGHSGVSGDATLAVEIDILFFSTSVHVSVHKEFAGAEADPLFLDFIPSETVWQSYCEAFA